MDAVLLTTPSRSIPDSLGARRYKLMIGTVVAAAIRAGHDVDPNGTTSTRRSGFWQLLSADPPTHCAWVDKPSRHVFQGHAAESAGTRSHRQHCMHAIAEAMHV